MTIGAAETLPGQRCRRRPSWCVCRGRLSKVPQLAVLDGKRVTILRIAGGLSSGERSRSISRRLMYQVSGVC